MYRAASALFLFTIAACGSLNLDNGKLECSQDGRCPENFYCAMDVHCWLTGTGPDGSASHDGGGTSDVNDDLLASDAFMADLLPATDLNCGRMTCADACVDTLNDTLNCGGCGLSCSANHMASIICFGGACNGSCQAGYADCNQNKLFDGCEVDVASDAANCGACNRVCQKGANAIQPTCRAGNCDFQCKPGWANCDGSATNGCEIETDTDASNCGACGSSCGMATPYCINGQCLPPKRVFVSSATYSSNLGGLAGADSKCQGLANAAGLSGTFKAWLSDEKTSATARLTHSNTPYFRPDGLMIAPNWASLASHCHMNAITVNESGAIVPGNGAFTLTGSAEDGSGLCANGCCSGWTSTNPMLPDIAGGDITIGCILPQLAGWSSARQTGCNELGHIYCIEQ